MICGLGCYLYRTKQPSHPEPPQQPCPQNKSSKWIKSILYYKMDKKSIVNDLYHASLISVFAVGYSMLGKKISEI